MLKPVEPPEAGDHALLDMLDNQRWAERNFVVLNQRTAHPPYAQNYRRHAHRQPHLRPNEHFVHCKLLFTDSVIQCVCETPNRLIHHAAAVEHAA